MDANTKKEAGVETGGKHISHILEKAPEERDIRAYFRGGAMWNLGRTYRSVFRWRSDSCIIPQFYKFILLPDPGQS